MNNCTVSFKARATGPDLRLISYLNTSLILDSELTENQSITVTHEFDDSENEKNILLIVMSGKNDGHTELDAVGNITADRVIEISNVSLDNIDIDILYRELSEYTHNFNGTAEKTTEKFYGTMGCNGAVTFEFTGPVYRWLLENM